jgi:Domain of Unknown Function with PDB structure (DUF3857)
MKTRLSFAFLLAAALAVLGFTPALAQQWKPLDPAHIALKAPAVEKDADAEALLWEVYINDASDDTYEFVHFLRVKIFSERGRESQSRIDIPYFNSVQVKDISGRTIKPDGSIVELKKDAVFDREVVRFGGLKLKSKSFAMPGVEPGAIVEYRYREVYRGGANYVQLQFQRDIPVHVVRYYLKPHPFAVNPMRTMTFQGQTPGFQKERDGFYRTEMTNMPAFHEEPRMPPANQVRTWMLVFYSPDLKKDPMTYWKDRGKQLHEAFKGYMKVNDDVRRAAAEAIGDATAPEQKLERLFNFCRTKIKNVNDDASGLTGEQLQKLKDNRSPADTLKRGYGTGIDIDFLFGALASAAGFDARFAKLSDRGTRFFDINFTDDYFMRAYNIAVKLNDKWMFFDPSNTYSPFGMLRWQEEGIQALVTDAKEPLFVGTQLSPAEKSVQKRTATLRLGEDGTLEGDVRVEYTGHFAVSMKEDYDDETPEQREAKVRNTVQSRIGADVTEVKLESATDPLKPFAYSYKVRIPGYAERTGKRLFLQPAFFQKGVGPMFPTSERRHDIYFHFPWMEQDHVTIELPAGFTLDNAEAPNPLDFGQVGKYEVNLGITQDKKQLDYKRTLRFSGLIFKKDVYPQLKRAFDALHQQDNHAVTLKQAPAAALKQ